MIITPTILVNTFAEFENQLKKVEPLFPYVQIDIMDGKFVDNTSFKERQELEDLKTNIKFELHLMVEHPLDEMDTWHSVKNIFRALIPLSGNDKVEDCLAYALGRGWEAGLTLNPETPLTAALPYLDKVTVVQFMTVNPGHQGSPFLPEVLTKIKEFVKISPRPKCAVDGSVNMETIGQLKEAGVEIFNVGSALMEAEDVGQAYLELKEELYS
jgi:ribulose-phosphate 3-epimerase